LTDFKKLKNTKITEISERFTMNMKPIRTAKDHKDALAEISKLVASDQDIDTLKGKRLDVLVTLVQAFESQHFPMPLPDPIEAINFRMKQQGLNPKDFEPTNGKVKGV
jgi:HTH-type transcriptional regulator/antitoxin HigA